ncbi:MAG: ATP-binding protein, partial [Candidatus Thiodiazotropha sp.]
PHELQQVLVNLFVNAVHALDSSAGIISLSTDDWDEKGVVIRIEDNGMGIEEEQTEMIFNPFHTSKRVGEGTGLGLSVSYGLIKKYGGDITVRSDQGQGSLFSVWILQEPDLMEEETALMEQFQPMEQTPDAASSSVGQGKQSA